MIYTSITNGRDRSREDIPCFTVPMGFKSHRMNAKVYKVLSHLFVQEDSIWVDGNIYPKRDEAVLLEKLLGEHDVAAFKHPWRKTVSEEVQCILGLGFIEEEMSKAFRAKYKKHLENDLFECGILLRRNNARVKAFNEIWWQLLNEFPPRDQITFPIAITMVPGLKVRRLEANIREHRFFDFRAHSSKAG